MPIAVILGLFPMAIASATPIRVVPPDKKARKTTVRYNAESESIPKPETMRRRITETGYGYCRKYLPTPEGKAEPLAQPPQG
jgi:hypothetical protein